jgi:formate--tetrahydrofolate ligase
MKSDLDINQAAELKSIDEIVKSLHIQRNDLDFYGSYQAKLKAAFISQLKENKTSKLILVTAMSPTPAGEGKTTTTIGLADALFSMGKKSAVCIREPSLGPVFGMKGGATGGGYAQVAPMDKINLHFTGDFHAITSANNLLAALIDNHIHHGNELNIDIDQISFRRCLDMNDRTLRNIELKLDHHHRNTGFDITVASEVMAIFCLAESLDDLQYRLGEIEVAKRKDTTSVYAKDLKAEGAMTALLKDAFQPNVVQTLNGTPAFIHGGPFANIAHGCNSVVATKTALKLADYVVTEAGFGADLGAEKFIDIKCRQSGIKADIIVLVATIRALKFHGGVRVAELNQENLKALQAGFNNLKRHIENCSQGFGLDVVVAINRFNSDTEDEMTWLQDRIEQMGFKSVLCSHWAEGAKGAQSLAKVVLGQLEKPKTFKFLYEDHLSLKEKILRIALEIYRAKNVEFSDEAINKLEILEKNYARLPVCIAKTPYSFSSDPNAHGASDNHTLMIRELRLARGAGFVVAICGDLMTMPGLPKIPASEKIRLTTGGLLQGLN